MAGQAGRQVGPSASLSQEIQIHRLQRVNVSSFVCVFEGYVYSFVRIRREM